MIPLDPKHIDDGLLGRYLEGACTPEEEQQVRDWLEASEANRSAFAQFKTLWDTAATATPKPAVNVDAAWSTMQARMKASAEEPKVIPITEAEPTQAESAPTGNRAWMLRVAAVLVIGLAVFGVWRSQQGPEMTLLAATEITTVTLADGSRITLNTNATLEYPETWEDTRDVTLTGEAFFEVTPDASKPFVIHTADANVRVLGTSFNVRALPDAPEVEVAVESGTVELYEPDNEADVKVTLEEGHKGIFSRKKKSVRKQESFEPTEAYWRAKMLIFKRTRLEKVALTLENLYGIDVAFSSDKITRCKLNTTFHDVPIDGIMEVIATTFDLELTQEGNRYLLTGESCPTR